MNFQDEMAHLFFLHKKSLTKESVNDSAAEWRMTVTVCHMRTNNNRKFLLRLKLTTIIAHT